MNQDEGGVEEIVEAVEEPEVPVSELESIPEPVAEVEAVEVVEENPQVGGVQAA